MQNPALMRVLHGARYLGHEPHTLAWLIAQDGLGFLQAAPSGVFHAEERQPIFTLTYLVDGKNIGMIETGSGLGLTPKTFQRIARIGLVRHDTLECDDPARMPLP